MGLAGRVKGDGDIHVGTMHRVKGLGYRRLALVGARDGSIPRASVVQRYRDTLRIRPGSGVGEPCRPRGTAGLSLHA
ncbi:hypothetical protein [Streptomyces viridosporus]|uniref:hypothetical protein n=1 Tax=Streptomyces viridosporus TaxID=67581 RepID=UPI0036F797DA